MKISALWFSFFVFLAPAGLAFEGRIHFLRAELSTAPEKLDQLDEPHSVIVSIKNEKMRIEVIRERVSTYLIDAAKKQTITIIEDDRAFVLGTALAPDADAPRLEKTAETATMLDRPVRKYEVVSEEGKTELWLTEGIGPYLGFGDGYERYPESIDLDVEPPEPLGPRPWEYALAGQPLFPLRVVTRDAANREIFRLEATALTLQSLGAPLFAPSPNYTQRE